MTHYICFEQQHRFKFVNRRKRISEASYRIQILLNSIISAVNYTDIFKSRSYFQFINFIEQFISCGLQVTLCRSGKIIYVLYEISVICEELLHAILFFLPVLLFVSLQIKLIGNSSSCSMRAI